MIKFLRNNLELIFWLMAVVALGFTDPAADSHFVLCPLRLLGFKWCPGCGIGHSISFLLRVDIKNSFKAHWLGIPALVVTFYRIGTLIVVQLANFKLKACNYER